MARTNLKLIESVQHYRKEVALFSDDATSGAHSLHSLLAFPDGSRPEFAQYCIEKFSQPGDLVLDPFCGAGTTALEAMLRGRVAYASDTNALALTTAKAKIDPADITEVTLFLQMINLRRPIDLELYRRVFSRFYDVDTFREIVNLRSALLERGCKVSTFILTVAASLLHGHTAAYFSVYSFPQVSLRPEEQERINLKRRQTPDYRAIVPRILRKTASALRDGVSSSMRQARTQHRIVKADARNLLHVPNGAVQLYFTAPPLPSGRDQAADMWLKLWFADIAEEDVRRGAIATSDLSNEGVGEWLEFMSEVLFEAARAVRPGGRAAFVLPDISIKGRPVALDAELQRVVQEGFARFWDAEVTITNTSRATQIGDGKHRPDKILILRRK